MSRTTYFTPRGQTEAPVTVQVWHVDETTARGSIFEWDRLELTWADRAVGYLVLETLLDDVTRFSWIRSRSF